MEQHFDLIVIGTGSAGSGIAHDCRSAGWSVAIIDSRPFGGTCALRGCDPKKVLVGVADMAHAVERMRGKGAPEIAPHLDWPDLMRFKRTFTGPVPQSREAGYAKAGITALHGLAHFTGPATLQVAGATLSAKHIAIASGAKPAPLDIPGEQFLTTSEQFLELENLPRRVVFVGGGYISFEFANVAARAGAQVSILHRGPRPLAGFDPDLVDSLVQATREMGIDVRVNTPVESIRKQNDGFSIGAGAETFEADLVVHGGGRVADIDEMQLRQAGVDHTRKGVTVNQYLQSVSNPAVYAAGDAAASGGLPLTPVASAEGHAVAKNLLHGNHEKVQYTGTPTVVFTIPPLASVGLLESAAKEQGLKFKTNFGDTSQWYSSRRLGIRHSGFKVLLEDPGQRILGAHLYGPHADEVINLFALAIRFNIPASELRQFAYAYPTNASDIAHML